MTKKDLKKLESLLIKDKRSLEKKIKKLGRVDYGNDIDSGDEETDETEEIATNAAISRLLSDRLRGVDMALSKIKAGTYGVCENCGKEISAKLLQVDPESKLCQECKLGHG